MKKLNFFVILLAFASLVSCTGNGKQTTGNEEFPMFWTWLNYRPGMNFDSVCVVMKDAGLDGVILNAPSPDDYRIAIPVAHKHGLHVYAWLWTMNLEHDREAIIRDHPDWFSVNRKGESLVDTKAYVDYYKFMCPALPEVRAHIKEKIRAYCEVEGLNGIAIDYHRFVDVILPTTLWPRYGIVQDKEYPEWDYGYHPAMIKLFQEKHGYDPREQEDPSTDELWLQFRCDQITEVANEIAEVVHSYGKVMAASPFPTPEMSKKMVRQDWGKWNLDIVFPMVYHNFYTGDVSFISDCTIDNVKQKNPNTTLFCGMTGTDGPQMFECMDAALNNGAEGIAIFTIGSLRSPETRAQFRAYTDSVRALRAQSKVNQAATGITTVNTNPFEKPVIMEALQMRVSAYAAIPKVTKNPALKNTTWDVIEQVAATGLQANTKEEYISRLQMAPRRAPELKPIAEALASQPFEPVQLGEYKLVDEYGATKCYEVKEEHSGIVFDAKFYFYGGIISGWSIEPKADSYENYRKHKI
ncbi:hypothetical protein [Parabacteroides sp. PF5-9]|uniref:hypothetical protein n=1 Tax=Parabacteroides sp. PF5-9 TaxID=1742404 RepID=UPI002473AAAD|nr:hypothetical protein [Parabacteroides sp. PF5-9]MDH6356931.1 hypothetical protein [Parabacteroides sp. PF5-9]